MTYPLSTLILEPHVVVNNVVTATIGVDLNAIDVDLIHKYGPATVDTGGTFGVTEDNEDGVVLTQQYVDLKDGIKLTRKFMVTDHPDWAAVAATDWHSEISDRVEEILVELRTTDALVVLGDRTAEQV